MSPSPLRPVAGQSDTTEPTGVPEGDGVPALVASNDTGEAWAGTVQVRRLGLDGSLLAEHEVALDVPPWTNATLALPADTRLMILAPVVRDRKGEFVDLFTDMQAQGYVRFRVDGKTVEAADVPKLKKAEKHDIDVVIDRIRVQPGIEQRLAESYEAALRIAEGRALAVELDAAVGEPEAAKARPA